MVVTICFRRASIPYCPNIRTVEKLAESDWAGHDNLGLAAVLRSCYFIADSVDLVHILVTKKSDPTKHCAKSAQFRNSPPTGWTTVRAFRQSRKRERWASVKRMELVARRGLIFRSM